MSFATGFLPLRPVAIETDLILHVLGETATRTFVDEPVL